jgi:hypothetical protein
MVALEVFLNVNWVAFCVVTCRGLAGVFKIHLNGLRNFLIKIFVPVPISRELE